MAERTEQRPIVVALVGLAPIARSGVVAALQAYEDIAVAHVAENFDDLDRWHDLLRIEVVLADGREFPPSDPRRSHGAVVVLSDDIEPATVWRALDAGARGYLSYRETGGVRLASTVRQVLGSGVHLSPNVAHTLVGSLRVGRDEPVVPTSWALLTSREAQILDLMGAGLAGRDIADRLGLTEGTVRNNLHRIYGKLGVRGRAEAVGVWFAAHAGTTVIPGRD